MASNGGNRRRFGMFELDVENGELLKEGKSVRLQPQPAKVLAALVAQPGELVTRQELKHQLWGDTTFVDFEQGLNFCIRQIRIALDDSADSPRFIETVPRRGYRLVAPVEPVNGPASECLTAAPAKTETEKEGLRWKTVAIVAALLTTSSLLAVGMLALRRTSTSSAIHSVAVLPLQNLSGDPAQEFFSEGLTDALITDLARTGKVKIISSTSSARYKGSKESLPTIAKELGADVIVEGTVQHSGNDVRVTAQVIEGQTDKHLWANHYERDNSDVFALERELADDITSKILENVGGAGATPPHLRPVDSRAFEAYLQACYHLQRFDNGFGDEEKRQAQRYLEQAIKADPTFSLSYVKLASAHSLQWPEPEDLPAMLGAARKAVDLDPSSADARVALGNALWASGMWGEAQEQFRRGIALEPNNQTVHISLSNVLLVLGFTDEAWKEAIIARQLDANSENLSWVLYARGDYDGAIQSLSRFRESHPHDLQTAWSLSENYWQKGMYKEWIQELSEAMTRYHIPNLTEHLQRALRVAGPRGAIRQWAKELQALNERRQLYYPGAIARAYAMSGDTDRAFFWLEEAYQHRDRAYNDPYLWGAMRFDPGFASLRADARFNELLSRLGLPKV